MTFKKSGKKTFGVELSAKEQKALDLEVTNQLAEWDRKHELEIDAIVLYILFLKFGFGKTRLRRMYDELGGAIKELINRYEFDNDETIWLCTKKLKEQGIDLEEWNKERNDIL